jgi:hypothetical protein
MLEAILIMCIVYACQLMPLRGKTFYQLTPKQQQRVDKNFRTYMTTKKGKLTPNMNIEEYLPILQKQAITYLIMAIVVLPIYVLVVFAVYSRVLF